MTALRRLPVTLAPDTLAQLKQVLNDALPYWGGRTGTVSVEEVEQPFFKAWKILEVISPAPLPDVRAHLAWRSPSAPPLLLTGLLSHLYEVAQSEPPRGLTDDATAESYAWNASGWTTEAMLRDFRVNGIADMPWLPQLSPVDHKLVEEVKELADKGRLYPARAQRTAAGFELRYTLLNNKRLIERTLLVPPSGLLTRKDVVLREGLPVPPGRLWKMIKGRPTPAG